MTSRIRVRRCGPLLCAFACAAGCGGRADSSNAASAVRDSAGITIVENASPSAGSLRLPDTALLSIGDGLPVEQTPLDPTAVFVDANERILVGDGNQVGWDAILVYDRDGRFLMKVGGKGRGPGEFGGQLWWAGPYRGDSIVAWDRRGPTGPSMKIYGPDGGYARDVPMPNVRQTPPKGTFAFSPGFHGAFADGALLTSSAGVLEVSANAGPTWYHHYLLITTPGGMRTDTVGRYGLSQSFWDGQKQTTYLFGAATIALPYGNDFLLGDSESAEYRVIDRHGQTKRIVRWTADPAPVETADVEAVTTRFLEAARSGGATEDQLRAARTRVEGYPRAGVKPSYSSIRIDPALRVWVERYRWFDPWSVAPGPRPATWDVFSRDGEWLAEVVVPAAVVLLSLSRDRALGVHVDELDVKQVVAFALPTF